MNHLDIFTWKYLPSLLGSNIRSTSLMRIYTTEQTPGHCQISCPTSYVGRRVPFCARNLTHLLKWVCQVTTVCVCVCVRVCVRCVCVSARSCVRGVRACACVRVCLFVSSGGGGGGAWCSGFCSQILFKKLCVRSPPSAVTHVFIPLLYRWVFTKNPKCVCALWENLLEKKKKKKGFVTRQKQPLRAAWCKTKLVNSGGQFDQLCNLINGAILAQIICARA